LDSVSADHPEVALTMINAAEEPEKATALGVRGTPTLIGYSNGEEVFRSTGRRTVTELRQIFDAVADGTPPPRVGASDIALRVGSGAVLIAIGFVSGPAWVLIGAGALVAVFGLHSMLRGGP
jgi:hypothetical protein